jgi:hypothetical protein
MKLSIPSSLLAALLLSQGQVLAACTNTGWDGQDSGCSAGKNHCANGGQEVIVWDGAGDGCFKCINNDGSDGGWYADKGCDSASPHCVNSAGNAPDVNKGGNFCAAQIGAASLCTNTGWDGQDSGCSTGKNHCADGNQEEVTAWEGAGDVCFTCINTDGSDGGSNPDKGCTSANPHCVNSVGNSPDVNKGANFCN